MIDCFKDLPVFKKALGSINFQSAIFADGLHNHNHLSNV